MLGENQFHNHSEIISTVSYGVVLLIAIMVTWFAASEYQRSIHNKQMREAANHYFDAGVKAGYEKGTKDFFQNFSNYADTLRYKSEAEFLINEE